MLNPNKVIHEALKKFLINSLKHDGFEVYHHMIANCRVNCNASCPTMWVFFDKGVTIEWSPRFITSTYEELKEKYTSEGYHEKDIISMVTDFVFLVLWHEILHVMFGHLAINPGIIVEDHPKITRMECNIAADWQVNSFIVNSVIFRNMQGHLKRYFTETSVALPNEFTYSSSLKECLRYTYFDWMKLIMENKDDEDFKNKIKKFKGDDHGEGGGEGANPMMGSMTEGDLKDAIIKGEANKPEVEKTNKEVEEEKKLSEVQSIYMKNKASGKKQGAGTGDITLNVTYEDVQVKLPPLVKDAFEIGDNEYHMKKHKIESTFEAADMDFGLKFPEMKLNKIKKDINVFCDTSGSMDNNSLKHVLPIIENVIRKHVRTITVTYCDTGIKREFLYKKPADLDPWKGGGGTDFEHAFEIIYGRGVRDMVVYTDGGFCNFTIPDDLKIIWLLVDGGWGTDKVDMPGHKVIIEEDRRRRR